jgi:radical SAM superfamily enzyme YgiQ (UPF0313 family)
MVYKNGPKFKIRPVEEIKEDLLWAKKNYLLPIETIFFPSGNSIIMKTDDFIEILTYTKNLFPNIKRITIYGSSQYVVKKGLNDMKRLADAGLSRIHVGLETGSDIVLKNICKGTTTEIQIQAGEIVKEAGIELSEYVVIGLGGKKHSKEHITETIKVLNTINPEFIRIRTFLPKINTPILFEIDSGSFQILSPHEAISETYYLISGLNATSQILSDHYTNYIQVSGKIPDGRNKMLNSIKKALEVDEENYRSVYIGTE